MTREALDQMTHAFLELEKEPTLAAARTIASGESEASAREAVDALGEALQRVGKRFQEGEWFLGELVYAGEIARETMDLLTPLLHGEFYGQRGSIIVGTVAGDLHDLGKDIFSSYAKSAGFEVIDLGVDVSAERFADAVAEKRPLALGISCLLTLCAGSVGKVLEELEGRGLREGLNVVVGGAALTESFAREVGVDAFAPDAVTGTEVIRSWSEA
jgi:methylmalonyl-CoA mutase cobalamin-binding domain/chain